jgi:NAD(P)-dependent dehydrogenase (short-subunit alcohol dehydrogenase family)
MSRIFITGSSDGLGFLAAKFLIEEGHRVVLHARNSDRAKETISRIKDAENIVTGDLSSITQTKQVAEQVNTLGLFDAVIFNAGIGTHESKRIQTEDGLSQIFAVNSLAPYILTCLINKPKRMVYTSSGLHKGGDSSLKDLNWTDRKWDGMAAYSDSKLHNLILAFAVARKWPDVLSNALEPGWVPTKMGGPGAPDSLEEGAKTQVWLAAGQDKEALVSGHYFYHKKLKNFNSAASDPNIQEIFLSECNRLSGVSFPVQ